MFDKYTHEVINERTLIHFFFFISFLEFQHACLNVDFRRKFLFIELSVLYTLKIN